MTDAAASIERSTVDRRILVAVAFLGVAARLLGITWGLPDRIAPGEPPFHPDEFVPYVESFRIWGDPTGTTFIWGGGFYMRLCRIARGIAEFIGAPGGGEPGSYSSYAITLLVLRSLNVLFALVVAFAARILATRLGGPRAGLLAFSFSMLFPGPALDAHFARPDVLVSACSSVALVLSLMAAQDGLRPKLFGSGVACGAGTAVMLSGVIGIAPLSAACVELAIRSSSERSRQLRKLVENSLIGAAGLVAGYLACNTEALWHPSAFRAGLDHAFSSHQGGRWEFPVRLLSYVPLYAFGVPTIALVLTGLYWLLRRFPRGSASIVAHFACGLALLGRVGFDMMRHLEFLAAAVACLAALGATQLPKLREVPAPRRYRLVFRALGVAALFDVAQLSMGYSFSMQFQEDARYRAGRWLAASLPPRGLVGITTTFSGDDTYSPRVPHPSDLSFIELRLSPAADARRYSTLPLDAISTTDYSNQRARGESARQFVERVLAGRGLALEAEARPRLGPLFTLARTVATREPADLSYTRASFLVYRPR